MVNDISDIMYNNIKIVAREYKNINIVTNHLEKFKKMEDQLLNDKGIMITIGNNKKRSLSKSQIIVNVDFPNEIINEYNIFDEAIIINIIHDVKINRKSFNGKIYNDFRIHWRDESDLEYLKLYKFNINEVYESFFYKNQSYVDIRKRIIKDDAKVIEVY